MISRLARHQKVGRVMLCAGIALWIAAVPFFIVYSWGH